MQPTDSTSSTPTSRAFWTGAGILIFCQAFFLLYLQFPVKVNFDEFHYVPAAREMLEGRSTRNWEHPPLGKYLMSVGMAVGGDRPFGWRLSSTFAGAWTAVAIYAIAFLLFGSVRTALWTTWLTVWNFSLYVQSRIGLLDTPMTAFLLWGLFFLFRSLRAGGWGKDAKLNALGAGILFGLALGCKWSALVALPVAGLFLWIQYGWRKLGWAALLFALIPFLVYVACLAPLLAFQGFTYRWFDFFRMHSDILHGLKDHAEPVHFYESRWHQWPLLFRSIWYCFDHEGEKNEMVRGVFLIGNPILAWGGLVATTACIWGAVKEKSREALWIAVLFLATWLFWIGLPRRIGFFYYYCPSLLILNLAIVWSAQRYQWIRLFLGVFSVGILLRTFWPSGWPFPPGAFWGIALSSAGLALIIPNTLARRASRWSVVTLTLSVFIVFWKFFPVLSARRIPTENFRQWMWLSSWI